MAAQSANSLLGGIPSCRNSVQGQASEDAPAHGAIAGRPRRLLIQRANRGLIFKVTYAMATRDSETVSDHDSWPASAHETRSKEA